MKWSDIIKEVVIAPKQAVWDVRDAKRWTGSYQIGERTIEIFFTRLSSFGATRWRVDFRKARQSTRGTVTVTIDILNGVIGAIEEFLQAVKPDRLELSPTNTSREKLYRAIIKRLLPQIAQSYDVVEKSYGTLFGEFIFSRIINLAEASARKDAADEDDRVFLAYCQKHKLKVSDLSHEDLSRYYAAALADRNQYPIPISEPEFLYHGTNKANLVKIAQRGLMPSERTQTRNPTLTAHASGRVFFTDTIRNATFYAIRTGARQKSVALLRVRRDALSDVQPDSKDESSIERTVPVDQIEVWNGLMWARLI